MTDFPARVIVDLGAISHNVRTLKERVGAAQIMSVVKANGYGHGLIESARASLDGGATWLGVAQLPEAMMLRKAGVRSPLLAWLHTATTDFAPAIEADVDLAVTGQASLEAILDAARGTGRCARIHLKIDTGLGRNGAFGTDIAPLIEAAAAAQREGQVQVVGILQHFAYADAPDHPTVVQQQQHFDDAVALAEQAGCELEVRHLANSAATLTNPTATYDLVRPGMAVYGLSSVPALGGPEDFGLRPAMTVTAQVALVKRVPAGTGVSYGHTYVTSRETTLIDIPLGYADGIPRAGSNAVPVLVGDERFTCAGRVCMDQFMVDVGDHTVREGEEVILFGDGRHGCPTAQDWADATGTISYEIITRIAPRLPRTYI